MLRLLFCFVASLLFYSAVSAQETVQIRGVIKNGSGATVPHATILIDKQTVVSSESGSFEVTGLKPGVHRLSISSVGYEPQWVMVDAKKTVGNIVVILQETNGQLQTVEVTGRRNNGYRANYSFAATKVAIPVTEIPSTVSTITQQYIQDRQAVRFDDVARQTNVRVTNNGRSVVIRGFVSTTRLINGLRTLNESYRFPAISPLVESYEVVKGPSSSMFGNMSPGGVVNLVTKKPLAEKRQSVSVSTGSFNTVRGDLDFTGKMTDDGKVLYRINAFGQLSDTWYQNMKDNGLAIAPSFSFLPREGTRINVDFNHTQLVTMENDGIFPFKGKTIDETPIGFTVLQTGDRNKTITNSLNLSVSQSLAKNVSINVSYLKDLLSWDDRRHTPELYLGNAAWSAGDSNVRVAYSEWNAKMDADNITGYLSAEFNTGKLAHKALIGYDYNVSLFNWGTYRYTTTAIGSVNVYDPSKKYYRFGWSLLSFGGLYL